MSTTIQELRQIVVHQAVILPQVILLELLLLRKVHQRLHAVHLREAVAVTALRRLHQEVAGALHRLRHHHLLHPAAHQVVAAVAAAVVAVAADDKTNNS